MADMREASSPAAYCRKKVSLSLSSRSQTAASVADSARVSARKRATFCTSWKRAWAKASAPRARPTWAMRLRWASGMTWSIKKAVAWGVTSPKSATIPAMRMTTGMSRREASIPRRKRSKALTAVSGSGR
ncbi:hypothetical protein D3C86_1203690 [compost metagenome]